MKSPLTRHLNRCSAHTQLPVIQKYTANVCIEIKRNATSKDKKLLHKTVDQYIKLLTEYFNPKPIIDLANARDSNYQDDLIEYNARLDVIVNKLYSSIKWNELKISFNVETTSNACEIAETQIHLQDNLKNDLQRELMIYQQYIVRVSVITNKPTFILKQFQIGYRRAFDAQIKMLRNIWKNIYGPSFYLDYDDQMASMENTFMAEVDCGGAKKLIEYVDKLNTFGYEMVKRLHMVCVYVQKHQSVTCVTYIY